MPGHVLWTDDMILADLAKTEFGVRRVWTEAALQARAQAGNLDPAELATASTKLAGWGYSFTSPSIETLMRAGSVAVWNPDQFPLKQGLDQFAADSMSVSDAVTTVHATPHEMRSKFAREIWGRRRQRYGPTGRSDSPPF